MANKETRFVYLIKDKRYVQRFFYDVLVYTLPKCGLSETKLPSTEIKQNVYDRANFLEMAGAVTLRISLAKRDNLNLIFKSRQKSSGFSNDDIENFLVKIVLLCSLTGEMVSKSPLEVYLALCNEIMMFFHHEGINIHLNTVIDSICMHVLYLFGFQKLNISEAIYTSFDDFTDITSYNKWIIDFVKKFAIPYGSNKGLSERFLKEDRKRYKDAVGKVNIPEEIQIKKLAPNDEKKRYTHKVAVEKVNFPENIPIKKLASKEEKKQYKEAAKKVILPENIPIKNLTLKAENQYKHAAEKVSFPGNIAIKLTNRLGFLPHELYSAMSLDESTDSAENLVPWFLPGDRKSPKKPPLSANSESDTVWERNSRKSKSTEAGNEPEQAQFVSKGRQVTIRKRK